ncbi:metallophosphoesterase [Streptomyces avicenniae]|uniref:metallophosphoesterase n=1 Tax=Streptomyces avicenniae TaxID=500153 RepID=UPI000699E5A9|nr:metallophosphoesterase [Streptomyces avicenniae]
MVLLVILVLFAIAGIHWYLWKRLVRDVSAPGSVYRRTATVVLIALAVTVPFAIRGRQMGLPFGAQQVVAWPGFVWIVAVLYLVLALLVGEVVRPVVLRLLRRRDAARAASAEPAGVPVAAAPEPEAAPTADVEAHAAPDGGAPVDAPVDAPGRRLVVSRGIAVGAGLIAAGTLGYGVANARNLRTKHVTVTLPKLPRAADRYRVAVVSDIHLGPVLGGGHCRRVVDAVNRTRPDVIAVVGDLVDADVDDLRSAVAPMADLSAPDGTFFVTGNHEYYVETAEWIDHLRDLGLLPLVNERAELPYFALAGVNDISGEGSAFGGPDYGAALGDRDRSRATVLMAHQPVMIHDAVDWGVDLQLSGHTHGGQMWPLTYIAGAANPTLAGLERYGDTQLYVTRGAGAWGPPVRVAADPDVTLIELRTP